MKFTGERVVPGQVEPDLMNEHLARYRFAEQFAPGKIVLDIASGAGYGSSILGHQAKRVFGIDIDQEAVQESRLTYRDANVFFSRSDCSTLPFADKQFDVVVAFEIIEHLEKPERLVNEISRVLSNTGIAIVSTPNRLYYTEERGEVNEFHHHEFTFQEFYDALKVRFPYREILLQNHVPAVSVSHVLGQSNSPMPKVFVDAKPDSNREDIDGRAEIDSAYFFVAVCSKVPLQQPPGLVYLPSTGNVLRERERHIGQLNEYLDESQKETALAVEQLKRLEGEITELRAGYEVQIVELNKNLEERKDWVTSLDRQLSEKGQALLLLQKDYDEKIQWAMGLNQEIETSRNSLTKLQKEFEERTAWALSLKSELEQCTAALEKLRSVHDALRSNIWNRIGDKLGLNRSEPRMK